MHTCAPPPPPPPPHTHTQACTCINDIPGMHHTHLHTPSHACTHTHTHIIMHACMDTHTHTCKHTLRHTAHGWQHTQQLNKWLHSTYTYKDVDINFIGHIRPFLEEEEKRMGEMHNLGKSIWVWLTHTLWNGTPSVSFKFYSLISSIVIIVIIIATSFTLLKSEVLSLQQASYCGKMKPTLSLQQA